VIDVAVGFYSWKLMLFTMEFVIEISKQTLNWVLGDKGFAGNIIS
jgi:hypothetical protein